jgi:hypothetical protein
LERAAELCAELFERALRPWYAHAVSATIDVFAEFPMFDRRAIARLERECREFHAIEIGEDSTEGAAVRWIKGLLDYLDGNAENEDGLAEIASELQVLRSYRSVCHGDLHLDNVLVIGKPGAEYPCVIDFEATHEGYVLKDFGRFVASVITRTYEWSSADRVELMRVLPYLLLRWDAVPTVDERHTGIQRICTAILAARNGIRLAWRAGSSPSTLELVAALVASLLPYARYPDTPATNASLALTLSAELVRSL